jgi:NAD(P)-dependent dehydrogenase (short-subunit alcohol dehydrogenase family)
MYPEFEGVTVVITGAGAGIGRAIALRFASEGATVIVNDLDDAAASAVVDEAVRNGWNAEPVPGDMTDLHAVETLFDQVVAAHGGVDIAVNNVGLFELGDILDQDLQRWRQCLDINLTSAYLCSRRAAVEMRKASGGSIVNISSGAGKLGSTLAGGYGAAKAAVIGLTRSLAAELAPTIRVNCVCPGLVDTEMNRRFAAKAAEAEVISLDEFAARRIQSIPLKRLASPDDVANAVAFLASRQAAYTTGEALNVSGGLVML